MSIGGTRACAVKNLVLGLEALSTGIKKLFGVADHIPILVESRGLYPVNVRIGGSRKIGSLRYAISCRKDHCDKGSAVFRHESQSESDTAGGLVGGYGRIPA